MTPVRLEPAASRSRVKHSTTEPLRSFNPIILDYPIRIGRRVAEIQIFEKTYLIVIKDETCLKFKLNDSTLFLIGSYAQKLVASY